MALGVFLPAVYWLVVPCSRVLEITGLSRYWSVDVPHEVVVPQRAYEGSSVCERAPIARSLQERCELYLPPPSPLDRWLRLLQVSQSVSKAFE